jgi:hypothetical protein
MISLPGVRRLLRCVLVTAAGLLVWLLAGTPAHAAAHHVGSAGHRSSARHHAAGRHHRRPARHRGATGRHGPATGRHGSHSVAPTAKARTSALEQMTGLRPSQVTAAPACAAPHRGWARCDAQIVVTRRGHRRVHARVHRRPAVTQVVPHDALDIRAADVTAAAAPAAGTPAYLQQAYDLTSLSQTAGGSDTVAIVDAYANPTAESDLATWRAAYGLPACSTANGCFREVNQNGQASPLPGAQGGWGMETALDLDAVSALCPNCHILLVAANDASYVNLDAAEDTAARLGANQISNSWSGGTSSANFTYPGVSVIASTGDGGFNYDAYPADLPNVVAAGGTTLTASATAAASPRGFAESAWSGAGSGCASWVSKPSYQGDRGCAGRSYADVSADANPNTGLVIDNGGSWFPVGGTSLSAPLIAAYEALIGQHAASPQWAYTDSTLLNDPAAGSNGSCPSTYTYICTARAGYDGPTGNGSISGAVVNGAPGVGGPGMGTGAGNTYTKATTPFGATLFGGVYPNGLATTYQWQYGTTTAYGSTTAPQSIGSGRAPVSFTTALTGLTPSTTYHCRLVATNSAGTTYGYDSTLTTASGKPAATAAPAITGTARTGSVLSVSTGTWNPAATSYAYQWQVGFGSGWATISGATGATYTPTQSQVGGAIRAGVTATNGYGSTTSWSALTADVASGGPTATAAPVLSGSARIGSSLSVSTGTWSPAATGYRYQWQVGFGSGWVTIAGATGATFTPTQSQLGGVVRAGVTATNAYGSTTAWTAMSSIVQSAGPTATSGPVLSGTPRVGSRLSVTTGTWSPAATSYTYQWQVGFGSGWITIPGAAGSTFTVTQSQAGGAIRAGVTATNASGSTTSWTGMTGPVLAAAPAVAATGAPVISGAASVGAVLTASPGVWSPAPTGYSYRWQRQAAGSGTWVDIAGATSASYTLTGADRGAQVHVAVTATTGSDSATAYSAPVGPVS